MYHIDALVCKIPNHYHQTYKKALILIESKLLLDKLGLAVVIIIFIIAGIILFEVIKGSIGPGGFEVG